MQQYVGDWASHDKRRLVVFAPEVLLLFRWHRQRFACQREAGGVLLGHRRGSNLEVVLGTPPMPQDRRFEFMFEREPDGHAQAAMQAWEQAGNTIDYLGEWHTHPQRVPIPSSLDRQEWRKLGVRCAPKPLVVVVVGTTALHVEVLVGASQAALLPIAG